MLTLTTPTIRNNQDVGQARLDSLVQEILDSHWPPKVPWYKGDENAVKYLTEKYGSPEFYEHANRELNVNASAALQKGIYARTMRAKIDELAEIEVVTASTGELN